MKLRIIRTITLEARVSLNILFRLDVPLTSLSESGIIFVIVFRAKSKIVKRMKNNPMRIHIGNVVRKKRLQLEESKHFGVVGKPEFVGLDRIFLEALDLDQICIDIFGCVG